MKCPECGNEVACDVNVCPSCGYELIASESNIREIAENRAMPFHKNKKYIGMALFAVACILFIVAFTRVNNDRYSFYKQRYKECMEEYADNKLLAKNSGVLFSSTYEYIATEFEKIAKDDNKEIWKYRIQAIILCFGGFACCVVGYKMVKGEICNGISQVS